MYSPKRDGGFNNVFCANHLRTIAEQRICEHNVSYLQLEKKYVD